jgi:hypothetical protein
VGSGTFGGIAKMVKRLIAAAATVIAGFALRNQIPLWRGELALYTGSYRECCTCEEDPWRRPQARLIRLTGLAYLPRVTLDPLAKDDYHCFKARESAPGKWRRLGKPF